MSASTSHKHYFKTGHLAETTIPPAREHAPDAGRHAQTLNPAYPTPYRYGTMPFYPVLYHHHIINRQTPFMPITLNPIRISSAKFIKAQTVLINIGNLQQIVHQHQIIGRTHRAFENTVLYTLSVFHACLRHQTKTTLPLRGFRTHIVRNHNHHGFSPPITHHHESSHTATHSYAPFTST